jgi:L-asparaginase / beta-aspartyl-peptidase
VAHEVYALMRHKGLSLQEAVLYACQHHKEKIPDDRNLVAIDKNGSIVMEFETAPMFRGYRRGEEEPFVAVWREE